MHNGNYLSLELLAIIYVRKWRVYSAVGGNQYVPSGQMTAVVKKKIVEKLARYVKQAATLP